MVSHINSGTRYTIHINSFSGLFTGHDGVKGVSKSRRSVRVGSLRFKISRVGSGRVKRFSKSRGSGRFGSGRFGSGQEASKSRGSGQVGSRGFQNLAGRVGSGRVKRFSKSRGSGRVMTREIRVTSRVKP